MTIESFLNFIVISAWVYVGCGVIASTFYAVLRARADTSLFHGKMAVIAIIFTGLVWPLLVAFLINRMIDRGLDK
jgi:hypothetical protein